MSKTVILTANLPMFHICLYEKEYHTNPFAEAYVRATDRNGATVLAGLRLAGNVGTYHRMTVEPAGWAQGDEERVILNV